MAKTGRKPGRPRIEIDWNEFDKLCEIHCTQKEIAGWFNCSVDTIERACEREQGMGFADYYKTKRGNGKVSLRRWQWRSAEGGNTTMQIWLGKQLLGQSDKQELTGKDGGAIRYEQEAKQAREIADDPEAQEAAKVLARRQARIMASSNGESRDN